ncbi:MAG: hypothetical protein AB1689_20695 [Thermodesulfobacteriota bacterium]
MTRLVVTTLTAALLLASAAGAPAADKAARVACKDITAAMAGGKTAEQVASELGTRVKRVENCMARQRAGKKTAREAGTSAETAGAATTTKAKTTP